MPRASSKTAIWDLIISEIVTKTTPDSLSWAQPMKIPLQHLRQVLAMHKTNWGLQTDNDFQRAGLQNLDHGCYPIRERSNEQMCLGLTQVSSSIYVVLGQTGSWNRALMINEIPRLSLNCLFWNTRRPPFCIVQKRTKTNRDFSSDIIEVNCKGLSQKGTDQTVSAWSKIFGASNFLMLSTDFMDCKGNSISPLTKKFLFFHFPTKPSFTSVVCSQKVFFCT